MYWEALVWWWLVTECIIARRLYFKGLGYWICREIKVPSAIHHFHAKAVDFALNSRVLHMQISSMRVLVGASCRACHKIVWILHWILRNNSLYQVFSGIWSLTQIYIVLIHVNSSQTKLPCQICTKQRNSSEYLTYRNNSSVILWCI